MDRITGEIYLENGIKKESLKINYLFDIKGFQYYEVIRCSKGILLFLEDHLERLYSNLPDRDIKADSLKITVEEYLYRLVYFNENRIGNVKLVCGYCNNNWNFATYYIPHDYPADELFDRGIKLTTLRKERPDPNRKQIHVNEKIKKEIDKKKSQTQAYEILLIDKQDFVTEGSKSNIFFIDKEKLFSPPDRSILPGVTRKYVLKIAKDQGIEIVNEAIRLSSIARFQSAFICGTSPKILPVHAIGSISFQTDNKIITSISNAYNIAIQQYIEEKLNEKQ